MAVSAGGAEDGEVGVACDTGAAAAVVDVTDAGAPPDVAPAVRLLREFRVHKKNAVIRRQRAIAIRIREIPEEARLRYSFFAERICSARGSCNSGSSSTSTGA